MADSPTAAPRHSDHTESTARKSDHCDDEVIPLQERIDTVGDDADLRQVCDTEHHLLDVAFTRARDHLLVTGIAPGSKFLDDPVANH